MIKHLILATLTFLLSATAALAVREEIRIVGSPEVLPNVQRVAQNFALISEFAAPSLEVTGTGAGFRLFCDCKSFCMNLPVNTPLVLTATWQKKVLFRLMTGDATRPVILP